VSDQVQTAVNAAPATPAEGDKTTWANVPAKYHHVTLPIGPKNIARFDALTGLAKSLNCRLPGLIWDAIDRYLSDPPAAAPVGIAPSLGKAHGFWVIAVRTGKKVEISIQEVASRGDVKDGRAFFRYSAEDAKSRDRAKAQALTAAKYDAQLTGTDPESIKVVELGQAKVA